MQEDLEDNEDDHSGHPGTHNERQNADHFTLSDLINPQQVNEIQIQVLILFGPKQVRLLLFSLPHLERCAKNGILEKCHGYQNPFLQHSHIHFGAHLVLSLH